MRSPCHFRKKSFPRVCQKDGFSMMLSSFSSFVIKCKFFLFYSQKCCIFAVIIIAMMDYDISQPVPQGGDGAQDSENSRIAAIADELERLCAVYEAQCRVGQTDVTHFEMLLWMPKVTYLLLMPRLRKSNSLHNPIPLPLTGERDVSFWRYGVRWFISIFL